MAHHKEQSNVGEKMRWMLLLWIVLGIGMSSESPNDWPMFMHDPEHTGTASCAAPDTAFILWEYDTGVPVAASPVVVGDTVFLAAHGEMIALQIDTGSVIWSKEVPVMGSTPAVSGDTIVVGTLSGFAALNSETGELLWERLIWEPYCYPYGEYFISSPVIVGNRVYVGTGTNQMPVMPTAEDERLRQPLKYVICMDIESGEKLWRTYVNGYAFSSPAFSDNVLYMSAATCYAINPDDGELYWTHNFDYPLGGSPVIVDDSIIIAVRSHYEDSKVLRIEKTTILWSRDFEGDVSSATPVSQGKVVVITIKGDLYVLDFETGDILWSKNLGGEYLIKLGFINTHPCSPSIADGKIYVGTVNGLFSCLDLETGETMWQYQTEGAILASPAVAYEKVFVASTDGKLYCFGIDPETYFEKAVKYEKRGDAERAKEFYTRARDYYYQQGNASMVRKCKYELGKAYYWSAALVSFCMIGGALLIYLKKHKVLPK